MKARFLLPLFLVATARADDFSEELRRLEENREDAIRFVEVEGFVQQNNADYYTAAAGFWWHHALAKEAADNRLAGPWQGADGDPSLRQRALDLAFEGHRRFPQRFDLGLLLATLEFRAGRLESSMVTLQAILVQAKADPDGLTWTDNARLPAAPASFIPDQLSNFTFQLIIRKERGAGELCEELCKAILATYPDHPRAYTTLAELAGLRKDRDEVYRWLRLGHTKAASDPFILQNLMIACRDARRFDELRQLYADLLASDIDAETRKDAERSIAALDARLAKAK